MERDNEKARKSEERTKREGKICLLTKGRRETILHLAEENVCRACGRAMKHTKREKPQRFSLSLFPLGAAKPERKKNRIF